jgi:hypothetical protein
LPLAIGIISVTVTVCKEFSVTVTVTKFPDALLVATAIVELEKAEEAVEVAAADG